MKEYENVKEAIVDLIEYSSGTWTDAETGELDYDSQVNALNDIGYQIADLLGIDIDRALREYEEEDNE